MQQNEVEKNAQRYEYVRRLSPQAFALLWETNLKTGRAFDDLVDDAIRAQASLKLPTPWRNYDN